MCRHLFSSIVGEIVDDPEFVWGDARNASWLSEDDTVRLHCNALLVARSMLLSEALHADESEMPF